MLSSRYRIVPTWGAVGNIAMPVLTRFRSSPEPVSEDTGTMAVSHTPSAITPRFLSPLVHGNMQSIFMVMPVVFRP